MLNSFTLTLSLAFGLLHQLFLLPGPSFPSHFTPGWILLFLWELKYFCSQLLQDPVCPGNEHVKQQAVEITCFGFLCWILTEQSWPVAALFTGNILIAWNMFCARKVLGDRWTEAVDGFWTTHLKLRAVLADLILIQRIWGYAPYELLLHTNPNSFFLAQIRNFEILWVATHNYES